MTRERGDLLISRGKQDPTLQVEALADVEERLHGSLLIAQIGHSKSKGSVARVTSDRVFVVENADGNTVSSQAANDAEPLVVATEHDGTRRFIEWPLSLLDAAVIWHG